MNDQPDRCADCTTRPTCWINGICIIKRDSAKVEAPTPAADAQDSSCRAETGLFAYDIAINVPVQSKLPTEAAERDRSEIERLNSKLAIQTKLTRDAERQRDDMAERINRQCALLVDQEQDIADLRAQLSGCQAGADSLRAEAAKPFKLEENEQYRLQMAAICTAALGYWKEGDGIHPEYDTPALHDVAIRYAAYDKYYQECLRLQRELIAANDALIAAREQIAALVAEQRETDAGRARALRQYTTTRQFHQQQASMAPSRGVSIPVAELAVTEEEGEAFAAIPARTSAEIRLDDIEQRMERTENAYLVLQGRVNTHNDRLDALKDI